jgi:hypothetical protein
MVAFWTISVGNDDFVVVCHRILSRMALHELIEERLTHSVIGAFFDVYNNL